MEHHSEKLLGRIKTTLTPREEEIMGLVASGLSNQAIADKLTIDIRTVETHLDRVYQMLETTVPGFDNLNHRVMLTRYVLSGADNDKR